ncbi:hypothetical protein [Halegenticoccus soli]|uniref:hypothetical protein n=1 Tax=Halegenticoccus soli TaxID=1985678 RepID=UPI000C6EBEF6|nr:hypothetical protein [Halegenticoccus soli]
MVPDPATSPRRVSWRVDPGSGLRTISKYGLVGLLVALLVLAVGTVGFVALTSTTAEATEALLLVALALLFGGPVALVYLAVAAGIDGADAVSDLLPGAERPDPRPLVAGFLVGLAALLLAVFHPAIPLAYAGCLVALYAVDALRRTAGSVDPETSTLVVESGDGSREHDVDGLRAVRAVRLGGYALCLLRYDGARIDDPFLLVVPAERLPAVRAALEAIAGSESDRRRASRAERGILAALGLLFLGVAGFTALRASGRVDGAAVAYVAVALGFFGGLFLLVAWRA